MPPSSNGGGCIKILTLRQLIDLLHKVGHNVRAIINADYFCSIAYWQQAIEFRVYR